MNRKKFGKRALTKDVMWIYGKHAAKAALLNPKREIFRFILLESNKNFLQEITETSKNTPSPELVDKNYFHTLFGQEATHQGCAVLVKKQPEISLEELLQDETDDRPFIFLDQVADPQNIGSILRAAAVFGARAVVITEDQSPEITPAIAKAASGTLEFVPLIRVINLVQLINILKKHGFWSIGLDERAEKRLDETDLCGKFIFIIGNEGTGLRRLSKEACDFVAQLPGSSTFTTLNAAQAATVTLYESSKQRMKGKQQ